MVNAKSTNQLYNIYDNKKKLQINTIKIICFILATIFCYRCTQIKTYSWDNAQVILVGNKCDMEDERVISFERGKHLADSLGLEFFETSAKDNINVRVSLMFP